jgi:hypothetical protein
MAGLGAAIHVFAEAGKKDVDGRPAPAMTKGRRMSQRFRRLYSSDGTSASPPAACQ